MGGEVEVGRDPPRVALAALPTRVDRLPALERRLARAAPIWCKRDDLTSPAYGGNKIRKLEFLLGEAEARGAERLVTIGGVGSHHVLATTLMAQSRGLEVEAVLVPQPWTPHVEDVLRSDVGLALRAFGSAGYASVPWRIAQRLAAKRKAFLIPPGGSSITGSLGFVLAGEELAAQIQAGVLERPASIVVALGSGGTAAGLLIGMLRGGLLEPADGAPPTSLVAVRVVDAPMGSAAATLALSFGIARRLGMQLGRRTLSRISSALRVVGDQLGEGYGHPTTSGRRACEWARDDGLTLDPTYTAKTFAAVVALARTEPRPLLYWHTLSAPEPFERLVARHRDVTIPRRLERMMLAREAAGA
jgi:D-cysteine desulfhydrase